MNVTKLEIDKSIEINQNSKIKFITNSLPKINKNFTYNLIPQKISKLKNKKSILSDIEIDDKERTKSNHK